MFLSILIIVLHHSIECKYRELSFQISNTPYSFQFQTTAKWYNRTISQIMNSDNAYNYTSIALYNDLYRYGRTINDYISVLLMLLRFTGDERLLKKVSMLTQLMRSKLDDWSKVVYNGTYYTKDGYLNWIWYVDHPSGWAGTDIHQMDEMFTHTMVAVYTHAFCVNSDYDESYQEQCEFWKDYLLNHFEKKWRNRTGIMEGKFLENTLAHTFTSWIRYHYYMYKITNETWYLTEANRRVDLIKQQFKEIVTNASTIAYAWDHRVTLQGGTTLYCEPFIYTSYTMHCMADLFFEGFGFDEEFMKKLAASLRDVMMDNDIIDFAPDICGGLDNVLEGVIGVITANIGEGYGRQTNFRIVQYPYAHLMTWDNSTEQKIYNISLRLYHEKEDDVENPKNIFIPSAVTISQLYKEYNLPEELDSDDGSSNNNSSGNHNNLDEMFIVIISLISLIIVVILIMIIIIIGLCWIRKRSIMKEENNLFDVEMEYSK